MGRLKAAQDDRFRIGAVFGLLVIRAPSYYTPYGKYEPRRACPVRCTCGTEFVAWAAALVSGNTRSCGCAPRRRRGSASRKSADTKTC